MSSPTGEVRRVADQLVSRILQGAYTPGLRLPAEAELAAELGCGRSTLREALRHVADLGLVRSRRGSGATVLDHRREGTPGLLPAFLRAGRFDAPPRALAAELLRLRALLATEAVRLAARYAAPADLAAARARLAAAPGLAADPVRHAENELELYRALVAASRIWPAAWLLNALWAPLREMQARLAPLVGLEPGFQRAMEKLLTLVEQGDEQAAVEHVERWLGRVDARLAGRIERLLGALAQGADAPRAREKQP
ncbi:MAG: FadR family transcriptional regulator [Deltaproteobacteria bacterium]|nr:FadR family transcriptional regulator [Deltaproteobacteria bacterium]